LTRFSSSVTAPCGLQAAVVDFLIDLPDEDRQEIHVLHPFQGTEQGWLACNDTDQQGAMQTESPA
jgi:hypothetical protein